MGMTGAPGPIGPIGPMGMNGIQGPPGLANVRFADNGTSAWGIAPASPSEQLIAIPEMTGNATVRSIILYGSDPSVTFEVYNVEVRTGTPTLLGTGNVGTLLDIQDFFSRDFHHYLLIKVDSSMTSQPVFGGRLFRNNTGTLASNTGLTPRDFMINDDA